MTSGQSTLAQRLSRVQGAISEACGAAGRSSDSTTLIVITKFHPASLVAELAMLGVRDVGENRHQEAQAKAAELSNLKLTWHFVGQLQTKKARQAAQYVGAIHSIDRLRLIEALDIPSDADTPERLIDAFVQINLTDDPGRGGARPDEIEALAERVLLSRTLRLRGVMAVAPLEEEPERAFARLAGYSDRVRALDGTASAISAGMTHDFAEAIAAGATHLRIGTAITGNRPAAG
jgi:pyridoxal phosphate enzyme (YggS family)